MTINRNRKKYIDAVKGFCIVLVLFMHAGGIPYVGRFFSACYMQVYFVVAGITYNDRMDETLSQFALKKAKRLLIPYVVYGTILWIIDCIYKHLTFREILRGGAGVIYARHCLFLYHGHQNNLFLLDNLNEQLWFLPAIFVSYILFWFIVKADKKYRAVIVVGYVVINIVTSFLPILLPWSLDTVFITADLMYFGFLMKHSLSRVEQLNINKLFSIRTISIIVLMSAIYLVSVKMCGGINTSVRILGSHGALSISMYMIVGITGTLLFLIAFAIAENSGWLNGICNAFAYLGKHTIVLLATHIAVFEAIEDCLRIFDSNFGYTKTLIKVFVATAIGITMGVIMGKIGEKNKWIKLLE